MFPEFEVHSKRIRARAKYSVGHFLVTPNTLFDHYLISNRGFNSLNAAIHETETSHNPTRAGGNQGTWVSRACAGTLSGHPRTPHVL